MSVKEIRNSLITAIGNSKEPNIQEIVDKYLGYYRKEVISDCMILVSAQAYLICSGDFSTPSWLVRWELIKAVFTNLNRLVCIISNQPLKLLYRTMEELKEIDPDYESVIDGLNKAMDKNKAAL